MTVRISCLKFFSHLVWLDGRNLLDIIEPYRRAIFTAVFDTPQSDAPLLNIVLAGRAKKNWKSADLVLAALYSLTMRESALGSDAYIVANDEDQAGDDLALAKKIVLKNDDLSRELTIMQKEIRRRDGGGSLKVLPARDALGAHGKSAVFVGFDEIHGYRDWDLMEALQPDPTRTDALTWVTSYDGPHNQPGVPLYDLKQAGMRGDDPRMLFSWYSGDYCTDPAFQNLSPERRANPSMSSWSEGMAYLEQQRRRLPSHKYRRLHLNLPAMSSGAFLDPAMIELATQRGVRARTPQRETRYTAFVDMSGGSSDEAVLAIAHAEEGRAVLDIVVPQSGKPPFDPREAVRRFCKTLAHYGLKMVHGDAYAGQTFRRDFESEGVSYEVSKKSATDIYEEFEPRLNGGEIELLDVEKLKDQLTGLQVRGTRVDHAPGQHDDWANAAAGALLYALDGNNAFTGCFPFDGNFIGLPEHTERIETYRRHDGVLMIRARPQREERTSRPVTGLF